MVSTFKANPSIPARVLESISGYKYYNTSQYTLKNLLDDPDNIKINFENYFYEYQAPEAAETLLKEFKDLENQLQDLLKVL